MLSCVDDKYTEDTSEELRELARESVHLTERIMLKANQMVRELTQGEFCVLTYLESCKQNATAVLIADEVSLTRPRITQIITALENRGLVVRKRDDLDKRKVNIRITVKGRNVVKKQRETAIDRHMRFLSWLGDDRESFIRILNAGAAYFNEKEDAQR